MNGLKTITMRIKTDEEKILILDTNGNTFARVYFSDHNQRQHAFFAADNISRLQRKLE